MPDSQDRAAKILGAASRTKQLVAAVLLVLMFLVVIVATVELAAVVVREIWMSVSSPAENFILSEEGLLSIFGLFLNVLIAVELIETVEVYFREHILHAETIILVAIIAVARKAILLDLSSYTAATIAALAFLILALGASYFMVRRSPTTTIG